MGASYDVIACSTLLTLVVFFTFGDLKGTSVILAAGSTEAAIISCVLGSAVMLPLRLFPGTNSPCHLLNKNKRRKPLNYSWVIYIRNIALDQYDVVFSSSTKFCNYVTIKIATFWLKHRHPVVFKVQWSYLFILAITTAIIISNIKTQVTPTAIATIIIFESSSSTLDERATVGPGEEMIEMTRLLDFWKLVIQNQTLVIENALRLDQVELCPSQLSMIATLRAASKEHPLLSRWTPQRCIH